MPVDPKTPMIRKRTHGQFWPRLRILSPIAVISLVISMPMPATGAPGKIEERIFASGFENTAPYQPPIIVESSAYPDDWTDNFTTLQMGARYTLGSHNVKDVRLFLNGEEVTAAAQTTDRQVKYQPETPLSEGFHVAEVRISPVTHSWHFGLYDPERFVQSPEPGSVMPAGTRPPIRAEFSHLAHRIDVSGIRLFVSGPAPYGDDQVDGLRETYGLEVTADSVVTASSIEFIPEQPLADSPLYYVQLRAPDRYVPGALYEVNWKFAVGRAPEFLEFQPGPEELLPPGSVPTIRVRVDSGAHRLRSHDLRFEDYFNQVASDARLNPDGSYIITHTPAGELEPLKRYCYWLTVQNEVFLTGQLENICFRIDQEWGRELEILSPQQETAVDIKKVEVRVRATAVRGELKRVRINGKPASWVGDSSIRPPKYLYHVSHIELRLGENLIEVEAEFSGVPDDVVERRHIRVHYVPAPEVTIDSPSDWQSFGPIGAGGGMVPGGARDLTGSVQRPVRIEGRSST